jgi:RNA polymerase sigma-70 factor (ECF subfamily)
VTAAHEFKQFYLACFGRLVGQLALITGDRHEAEEVVQEAFTRAAARWPRLRHYEVPELWVRRVALNLIRERTRQQRRRLRILLRLAPRAEAVHPVSIEQVAVAEALRALARPQREVVVLHHLVGLPVEQLARELGLPTGTVKSRLSRARAELGRRLAEHPTTPKEPQHG